MTRIGARESAVKDKEKENTPRPTHVRHNSKKDPLRFYFRTHNTPLKASHPIIPSSIKRHETKERKCTHQLGSSRGGSEPPGPASSLLSLSADGRLYEPAAVDAGPHWLLLRHLAFRATTRGQLLGLVSGSPFSESPADDATPL
jgi:hypothetical protein